MCEGHVSVDLAETLGTVAVAIFTSVAVDDPQAVSPTTTIATIVSMLTICPAPGIFRLFTRRPGS
jgi:hypothetical protein